MEPVGEVVREGIISWKCKYPPVGTKLYTAAQLAAARRQGAEEERKKLNALLRQALDALENFKNPDFSAEESFEQCEDAIAAIAEVKP